MSGGDNRFAQKELKMSKNTTKKSSFSLLETEHGTDPSLGFVVAKNPSKIGRKQLLEAGLNEQTPNQAIRSYCLSCCKESPGEVRKCVSIDCSLYTFRMGYSFWRKQTDLEEIDAQKN